jgi:nucleoside-diphosphate-sugar epimerase
MDGKLIVLAGATGKLGHRIAGELRRKGVHVRAIVRPGTSSERLAKLREQHVDIVEVDLQARSEVMRACQGASCVVSTLLGLHKVMIEAQSALVEAAVEAGVPRFIPSDYAMDYLKIAPGLNRNLDLHREFYLRLEKAPIRNTTILNGAFMELLTGEAPLVLFKLNRVLYWGDNPNQLLDFTTMDDTAAVTAAAALDADAPSVLRVAGEQISASGLAEAASRATGRHFRPLRGGSLKRLERIINLTRAMTPDSDAPFPVWQGMQYLYCMFEGSGKLAPLDNWRFPDLRWTGVATLLKQAS